MIYKKYLYMAFILVATGMSYHHAYSGSVFEVLDQEPISKIRFLTAEPIIPVEQQMTCSHVQRRFNQLPNLINEYREVFKNNFELPSYMGINHTSKLTSMYSDELYQDEMYEGILHYMSERVSTNYGKELRRKIVKVSGFVSQETNDLDSQEVHGIGAYIFGKIEISSDGKFNYLPIQIDSVDGGWTVTSELSAGDICLEPKLNIFVLSGCKKSDFEFASCLADQCLQVSHYDWNTCNRKDLLTLDLQDYSEQIGWRDRRMGRYQ